jgi:anaerobic ribonucleoside-triphosphate reductase
MNLTSVIDNYCGHDEKIMDENANKDSKVFATQRDLLAGAISKEYALEKLLPKNVAEAHKKGWIHFHDLDYVLNASGGLFNCMLIDFPGMLAHGFTLGDAEITTPKSLRTAGEIIPQIIANVSSNVYGGVSAHRIDEFLEPYAVISYRKTLKKNFARMAEFEGVVLTENEIDSLADYYASQIEQTDNEFKIEFIDAKKTDSKLSEKTIQFTVDISKEDVIKEVFDTFQSLEFEISSLFSSNGQTPFVTFNFGLSTGFWGREIQKAILQNRIEGLGPEKRTAVFPKLVYTLKEGHNLKPGDPNYDIKRLAVECSTKRIYPDILSYEKVMEIYGTFVSPMGCRSFLSDYRDKDGNHITYGRRNIGVVSLNLPNIALTVNTPDEFMTLLDQRIQAVKDGLMYRYNRLASTTARNAPILYQYGATGHRLNPDETVQRIFNDGEATASIGYVGLHETATRFWGNDWQDNPEAKNFTIQVLRRLNHWKEKWAEETGIAFSIYSTPAESLISRFAEIDKATFGSIKDITDKGYYTNSFHLDVRKQVTPFEKIDFEADYPPLAAGGNICYVEQPSLIKNPDALEAIWDYMHDRVPFSGVNTPISRCYKCNHEGDFDADARGFYCPQCGNRDPQQCEVVERLCGYLGSVSMRKPISGRVKEMKARVKHQ